jgi:hypothetical protein
MKAGRPEREDRPAECRPGDYLPVAVGVTVTVTVGVAPPPAVGVAVTVGVSVGVFLSPQPTALKPSMQTTANIAKDPSNFFTSNHPFGKQGETKQAGSSILD